MGISRERLCINLSKIMITATCPLLKLYLAHSRWKEEDGRGEDSLQSLTSGKE